MNASLHIFNPETEYALANGTAAYTAPGSIRSMRAAHALLPASYAVAGDAILILDPEAPAVSDPRVRSEFKAEHPDIGILTPDSSRDWSTMTADPWGWNRQIASFLKSCCPGLAGIPSDERLAKLRDLAHRATTIRFLQAMDVTDMEMPELFCDADRAIEYYRSHRSLFLKAPWSSSGRGVMRTDNLQPMHVEPWIRGIVRSQGSVIVEPIYDKLLDFATEWRITDGKARFIGISVFKASARGKYHGNISGSQSELWNMIEGLDASMVLKQKYALESVAGTDYEGPLGIDMLLTRSGMINPCVEINFRHTMGAIIINPDDVSLKSKMPESL